MFWNLLSVTQILGYFEYNFSATLWSLYNHLTLRPRRISSRGSDYLLTKSRADQPRLSNVVQLRGVLPRVENGNKY